MFVNLNKCRYFDVITLKYIFPRKGPQVSPLSKWAMAHKKLRTHALWAGHRATRMRKILNPYKNVVQISRGENIYEF
jgi:hypothetical protein